MGIYMRANLISGSLTQGETSLYKLAAEHYLKTFLPTISSFYVSEQSLCNTNSPTLVQVFETNAYLCLFLVLDKHLPIPFSPQSLTTTILLSASMSLTILDSACKWDHVLFVFCAWLILLNIMSLRFIHVDTNGRVFSFLGQNNIPLHVYTTFSSSVTERLDCFHILLIMLQWAWYR